HVSALSKSFVRDPHDVVKSGDVVMVKVLDVDVARKRISLTLRLDDEVPSDGSKGDTATRGGSQTRQGGQRHGGKGAQAGRAGGGQRQGDRGNRPRRDDAPANSAMADALRRAGYTG
ncbi:MAG: S1 RNA-binding domain-containing protein, partial [Dermatophilaceae bacterium]|nr:S1 RNA-binding domain-containing protein [Dermatophilaceae bacterium]